MVGRLVRYLFGVIKKPQPVEPTPEIKPLSDVGYESLLMRLLDGVEQGWDQSQVLEHLGNRIHDRFFKSWLHRFGKSLLESSVLNHTLGRQMIRLGEIGCGEIGQLAQEIGRQLLERESKLPEPEPIHPTAETTEVEPTDLVSGTDNSAADEAEAWFYQGNQQVKTGDLPRAIASYDKTLKINPNSYEAWINRSTALNASGRYEEAIASYDKALKINSDDHRVWHSQGIALEKLGRYEEAIVSFDKALKINSDDHQAWFNQGARLERLDRHEEAIASYDKALQIKPEDHGAWFSRGNALRTIGHYEKAIASYDKALQIKPDDYQVWNNWGTTLNALGRYEEAIASYNNALKVNADDHQAWNNRGIALSSLGHYEEAIASYDKALQIKPDYYKAWFNRGSAADRSAHFDPLQTFPSSIALNNPALNQRGYEGELASYEEGLTHIHQERDPEGWGNLHQARGNAHYLQGLKDPKPFPYWRKAVRSYEEALKTLTEAVFPEAYLRVLQDLIKALLVLKQTAEAEELGRRSTDLLQRLLTKCKSPGRKKQLALEFVGFNQLTIDRLVQQGRLVQALEVAEDGKNACLSWLLCAWHNNFTSLNYSQMRQLLNLSTAVIYWYLSPAALTTFILKHNEPEPIVITTSSAENQEKQSESLRRLLEFEDWVREWNQQYEDYRSTKGKGGKEDHPWRMRMPQRLEQLKQILNISALLEELSGITQLILIPHRDLHRFPLHALFLLNEQFSDNCTITYLPSAQIGLNLQQHQPNPVNRLLSVEHPTSIEKPHDGEAERTKPLPSLEFAQIESEAISRMFSTSHPTRIRSNQATKTAVEDALERPHSIFHFTGHGVYRFSNPQVSALALAGEDRLTVADICQLPLQGYNLVSLSSCETAITGNQTITTEYVGLVSGFLSRNVTHVVSTLWTVESAASALVMIQFYRLLQQGRLETIALIEATQWLRDLTPPILLNLCQELIVEMQLPEDEGIIRPFLEDLTEDLSNMEPGDRPYDHPYYWAAFTLTGAI